MTQGLRPRRLGVFGGAFDPPHRAHVSLVRAALAQLGLDELRVVPTGQAWHKTRPLSPAKHRLAMAQLAFEVLPGVVVDEREILRAGPSYTIDTLQALAAELGQPQVQPDAQPQAPPLELYLLMGGDQWAALGSWHRWQHIAHMARLCVWARPGAPRPHQKGVPEPIWLDAPPQAISATSVREGLKDGRLSPQDLDALLPEAVARYISAHGLYGNPQPGPPALNA